MTTFTHAGVSKLNGKFKARFCNDAMRGKVLEKNGHTSIDIVQLKHPMSKIDAIAYLLSINFDNGDVAVRAALEAALDARSDKSAALTPPANKVNKAAPKKATVDAVETADLEDATV